MKRRFEKDFAINTLGLPYGDSDEVEIIKDQIYSNSRWSTHHELIFKYEDKYYQTTYSKGATEYQEERPWEYDDFVECVEVRPVEKVVIDYEPV